MSTTLRVSNLPDERRAILHRFKLDQIRSDHSQRAGGLQYDINSQMKEATGAVALAQDAHLWFVSHRMAKAVQSAAQTIPDGSSFDWDMIPDRENNYRRSQPGEYDIAYNTPGIVFFEHPVASVELDNGTHASTDAIMWVPLLDPAHLVVIQLSRNAESWSVTFPMEGIKPDETLTNSDSVRFLVAMWALSETRVAAPTHVHPSRASRKRSARQDIDEPAIKVMRLRRVEQSHHHHDTDSDHDTYRYSKRWVVSGHWRQQPYGPERLLRKPVYIEPHIKGPAWAPLDDREVIKAMVR